MTVKLKILGCSGGIGGDLRTTSMLIDHDILIDAGTGVGDLSIAELARIDHVFVTHSHMDHVASIPFLLDTVGWMRKTPVTVHVTAETREILREHLFNWKLWPDFTQILNAGNPILRYSTLVTGAAVGLGARAITPLPANHVVPAVGFRVDSGRASLVFTGDTTTHDPLWREVNRIPNLRFLIIETAFPNEDRELAVMSKHLCPDLLAQELAKLEQPAEVYITHLKPGEGDLIMREIGVCAGKWRPRMLQGGQIFEL